MTTTEEIAFLGPLYTYSHAAAKQYQDTLAVPTTLRPAKSIEECFQLLDSGEVKLAVVPFENSTNGSVVWTLDFLRQRLLGDDYFYSATAELLVPVSHCFFSNVSDKRTSPKFTHTLRSGASASNSSNSTPMSSGSTWQVPPRQLSWLPMNQTQELSARKWPEQLLASSWWRPTLQTRKTIPPGSWALVVSMTCRTHHLQRTICPSSPSPPLTTTPELCVQFWRSSESTTLI